MQVIHRAYICSVGYYQPTTFPCSCPYIPRDGGSIYTDVSQGLTKKNKHKNKAKNNRPQALYRHTQSLIMTSTLAWLDRLANSTSSTEEDSAIMQGLLRKMNFSRAVVTIGVVYLEGRGYPRSIHSVAKEMLSSYEGGIEAAHA